MRVYLPAVSICTINSYVAEVGLPKQFLTNDLYLLQMLTHKP